MLRSRHRFGHDKVPLEQTGLRASFFFGPTVAAWFRSFALLLNMKMSVIKQRVLFDLVLKCNYF